MKTKQEQIEEMAKVIQKIYITKISRNEYCLAQDICEAGYCKASDVIDEFVENIMTEAEPFLSNMSRNLIRMCASKMKKELAAEMRHEVEK